MDLKKAILTTLIYHDIFEYPLTLSEIHLYLIGKRAKLKSLEKNLNNLVEGKVIGKHKDLFYLKGKKNNVGQRILRQRYSKNKLVKAKLYAQVLRVIPSVRLVAVSGALAMGNSHKADDIDLVIVTSKNLLWTTRFFSNVLLWPFKRDPQGLKKSDRACLNLFLDESALRIKDQNLYTAHEIAQLKPLWDRDKTYSRLIKSNLWIFKHLPNWKLKEQGATLMGLWQGRTLLNMLLSAGLIPLETIFKNFQLLYMRSKITAEKIGEHQLFFHPKETQEKVLGKYNAVCNRLLKKL